MRRKQRGDGRADLVTAAEIGAFVFCKEAWRLQYGLELEPGNQAVLDAGDRHHARKAVTERIAGGSITLGRFLAVLGAVVLFLLLWWWLSAFRPGGSPWRRCCSAWC